MIVVSLGRNQEELAQMKELLKEFRGSPLGKWFMMNISIWIQKVNQNANISGEQYKGIMQTLMEIQLQMASRGKLDSEIQIQMSPKEKVVVDDVFKKQIWKEKVMKE